MASKILNTGEWQGSNKNFILVATQIAKRWGEDEAKQYDPTKNCFTFKTWQKKGYQVRKGEKAIKCLTYIKKAKIDDDGKQEDVVSFPRFINLFYIKQVDPIEDK